MCVPTAAWCGFVNSVSLIDDEQSSSRHVVSVCEDISQRKRAEEILEQQEQMAAMGRLTSSIIHEINNPLEAVLNLIYPGTAFS